MRHTTRPSRCAIHPDETRDERFAYLDMLIQAGWGAVPMHLIEIQRQKNGGVLPPFPQQSQNKPAACDDGYPAIQ